MGASAALLPSSSAAPAKEQPRAAAPLPHSPLAKSVAAHRAWPAPRPGVVTEGQSARLAPLSSALWAPAALFFQAAPIATYAGDCQAANSSFNLGDTVCVKVSGAPASGTVVVFSDPDNFMRGTALDVTPSSTSFSFTLPSASTTGGFDNRGTWTAVLVNTVDNSRRASASFTVHDPAQAVADVTISKTSLDAEQVTAGNNMTFRIFVTNQGPDSATNVSFTDDTLPNTTFVSFTQDGTPTFTCTPPAVGVAGSTACTKPTMTFGETDSFTAVYKLNAAVANGADLTDTVSVNSNTFDSHGSSNSSTVDTTASNPTPPSCTLGCPANITVTAALGATNAAVTFSPPTLGGTCGTVTTSPASGSLFPIGSTVVTSTTSDGFSCSFVVTVNPGQDTEAPSITCPADISVPESSSSSNAATVSYNTPTATDNSGTANVTCNPPSGSSFPVGTTQVVCTATDPSGNSASCSFDVTVTETACSLDASSAPPTPNAASLPTLTGACSVTLMAADDPTATDACGRTIHGLPRDAQGDPITDRTFDVPGTYTVVWTYTDSAGHTATQNQTIVILPDNTPPVPDAASLPTVTGECSAAITGDPPTATDNCAGSGIVGTPLDPLSYNTPGTHTVRWKFTDAAGNSTIQNQNVVVTDSAPPVPNVASLPTLTGECSVTAVAPTATDNCAGTVTATTTDPTTYTAQGTYVIHWTYTDAAGNTATQNQTVTVDDNTPPTITAPAAVTLNTGAGATSCGVTVSNLDAALGTASASDNCSGVTVARSGVPAGNVFPLGQTTVTYTATDVGGNTASATQVVTVVDNTPPTLNAPNVVVRNDPGSCSAVVNFTGLSASDNCGTANVNTSIPSGSTFPKGTTTVNVTATDGHGNTTTGSFTVTVNDTENPVVNVPANIVVNLPLNSTATSIAVSYSVTATDNCGVQSLNVSPASGSVFPVGTTTVTATATDTSGNVTTRTFTVTVLYDFTGFFSPVANPPTVNAVNAGRAIPVKFSLSGNKGLNIFAADSPFSTPYTCGNVSTVDVSQTVDATANSINYDASSDQYNFVWKTDSSWVGQCRTLSVVLNDGSTHTALFKFR